MSDNVTQHSGALHVARARARASGEHTRLGSRRCAYISASSTIHLENYQTTDSLQVAEKLRCFLAEAPSTNDLLILGPGAIKQAFSAIIYGTIPILTVSAHHNPEDSARNDE